ncbi:hypothetical protein [Clavibacter sp. km3a]|uniref:hypothetical protein n=1 Tax=Clavibacter sp. km3a TaxID=3459135 RepID=UPI00404392B8
MATGDEVEPMELMPDPEADQATGSEGTTPTRRKRAPAVLRPFPRRSLEESLRVPTVLKDKNGGNPMVPPQVASALGLGMSNTFFYLTASSRDFGFTEGTRDTPEIGLAPRGRRAVLPRTPEERQEALIEAFFSVEIFKNVVSHYGGSALPEREFLENTLTTTFALDATLIDEFIAVFDANTRFLSIGADYSREGRASLPAQAPLTKTLATPPSGNGEAPVCFIAMPFTERDDRHEAGFFDEVLSAVLTPAIVAAGFQVRTAKKFGSDVIQSTIVTELLSADLVVADLTEHNPNVLFELGMRMHADLPIALVRAKGTGAIFDVDQMLRVADYSPNLWPSTVARDIESLTLHIKAAWDDRANAQTYMRILSAG